MPLPLNVSCFSKIQIGFTFLVPAHLGSPGKGPLNGCVCVCVSAVFCHHREWLSGAVRRTCQTSRRRTTTTTSPASVNWNSSATQTTSTTTWVATSSTSCSAACSTPISPDLPSTTRTPTDRPWAWPAAPGAATSQPMSCWKTRICPITVFCSSHSPSGSTFRRRQLVHCRRGFGRRVHNGKTCVLSALGYASCCFCYTHTHVPVSGPLSRTTRAGWYQKKCSPTHTHPDHHTSFINFLHLLWSIASSLFNLLALQSFSTTSLQFLFGLPLGLGPSTSYSVHFFTQSSSSFCNTCP